MIERPAAQQALDHAEVLLVGRRGPGVRRAVPGRDEGWLGSPWRP
ncbi:hypothetical protein OG747_47210 [Streptomyces sp. NBC_01384]